MTWRIGIRILLWETASALVVLGVFGWLPLLAERGSLGSRGALGPFLFAMLFFLLGGATFIPPSKKSRSDAIMERARELHQRADRRRPRGIPGWAIAGIVSILSVVIGAGVVVVLVAGSAA